MALVKLFTLIKCKIILTKIVKHQIFSQLSHHHSTLSIPKEWIRKRTHVFTIRWQNSSTRTNCSLTVYHLSYSFRRFFFSITIVNKRLNFVFFFLTFRCHLTINMPSMFSMCCTQSKCQNVRINRAKRYTVKFHVDEKHVREAGTCGGTCNIVYMVIILYVGEIRKKKLWPSLSSSQKRVCIFPFTHIRHT